jgi:hypothetical protein
LPGDPIAGKVAEAIQSFIREAKPNLAASFMHPILFLKYGCDNSGLSTHACTQADELPSSPYSF